MDTQSRIFTTAYAQALLVLFTTQLLGPRFLYSMRNKAHPGTQRLLVSIPVILSNIFAPLLFTRHQDATTITLVAFNTFWLSSFKTVLWALNRSYIANPRLSFIQFAAAHLLPLTPLDDLPPHRRMTATTQQEVIATPSKLARWALINIGLLATNVYILQTYEMPPVIRAFFYGLALYALLSTIMDGPGAIASSLFGIIVTPHFDKPWLSSSVVSFWNKRWDLSAGNALRLLIYEPITQGSLVYYHPERISVKKDDDSSSGGGGGGDNDVAVAPPAGAPSTTTIKERHRKERKHEDITTSTTTSRDVADINTTTPIFSNIPRQCQLVSSAAAFLTSGLIHECIHWYLVGHFSGGRWLSFFLLQIPAVLAERIILGVLKEHNITIPRVVMTLYCIALECYLSAYFFWGPSEKAGIADDIISNVARTVQSVWLMIDESFIGKKKGF